MPLSKTFTTPSITLAQANREPSASLPLTAFPRGTKAACALDPLTANPWLLAVLLGLATTAIFLPAVRCGFVNWDDGKYVYQNPTVLGGLTLDGCRHAFSDVIFGYWAPLTILSYQLDATLFGIQPWGFHLTNVLLHAASTVILFVSLVRMTRESWASLAVAAGFGLHPLRVESVVWIAERKDVLSVFFLMLTLLAYERYCRRPDASRYAPVWLGMLASLLCKSTLVTLPVLLLLLDVWPLQRIPLHGGEQPRDERTRSEHYPLLSWRAAIWEKLPLLGLSVAFSVITMVAQDDAIQAEHALPLVTSRLPNALHAIVWYVWKTFWPVGLRPFYRHAASELSPLAVLACGVAVTAAALAVVKLASRRPSLAVGLAWFGVALLPMLGIVAQSGFAGRADRFTYVPHIGLFMVVVWWAKDMATQRRIPWPWQIAGLCAVIAALAATSVRQIPMWKSPDTLWPAMLTQDPSCAMAHMKYANHLVATRRLPAAEPHYRAAIEHATDDWPGHVCRITSLSNLACLYHDLGEDERARATRDVAVEIDPHDVAVEQMLEHLRLPAGRAMRRIDHDRGSSANSQ